MQTDQENGLIKYHVQVSKRVWTAWRDSR